MRIKELNNKIAHVAWSPSKIYPSYIVSGTAAQQLDSSFSTTSTLDLIKLDLNNQSTDLEVTASVTAESRFNKILWNESSGINYKNIIVAGCENSAIYLYDYEKILQHKQSSSASNGFNENEIIIKKLEKHTGQVFSLDINPFQNNLLASGSNASEILIWDLNNPAMPMTPGAKIQPLDDINCLAWNHQVQHILASTCSGKCVVWDLRKNESIFKFSDNMSNMKAKMVSWHPDIATQMCLSSDDDHTPYLQLWDLRFATSPVRILEGHQRGILAFAWCGLDSNLLISSAKDYRILCWNPNNPATNGIGDIIYELPTNGQWCFDLSWCKRNPDLICASSYEGQINVYSLMGGKFNVVHQTSNKIMDSFGDSISPNLPASHTFQQSVTTQVVQQLKIAPKWMKTTCRASFAFGGKLVTFGQNSPSDLAHVAENQLLNQSVKIMQVITDQELVERSKVLQNTLQAGNLTEYCHYKSETAGDQYQKQIWSYIKATFEQNKSKKYLELLGFDKERPELNEMSSLREIELDSLLLTNGGQNGHYINSSFENLRLEDLNNGDDSQLLQQQTEAATATVTFNFTNKVEQLISEALIMGNYESVVDICIKNDRYADAILIASFFDHELLAKVQKLYFKHNKSGYTTLLEKILNREWSKLAENSDLDNWKETLVTLLTYTNEEEFYLLSQTLAKRLEAKASEHLADKRPHDYESSLMNACICYICSLNLDGLLVCWLKLIQSDSYRKQSNLTVSSSLQDTIEKMMVLFYNLERSNSMITKKMDIKSSFSKLNQKLIQYSQLLADQGCFADAFYYLNNLNDASIQIMKDRLYNSLDAATIQAFQLRKPECPFKPQQHSSSNTKSNIQHHQQQHHHLGRKSSGYQAVPDPSVRPPSAFGVGGGGGYYNQTAQTPMSMHQQNDPYNPYMQPPKSFTGPPSAPTQPTIQTYQSSSFNPGPVQMYPTSNQSLSTPTPPPQPTTQQQPPNIYTPQPQPAQPLQPQQQQTTSNPHLQSFMHAKPAMAWNDPPVVQPKIKTTSTSSSSLAEAAAANLYQPIINQQQFNRGGVAAPSPSLNSYYQPNMQSSIPPPTAAAMTNHSYQTSFSASLSSIPQQINNIYQLQQQQQQQPPYIPTQFIPAALPQQQTELKPAQPPQQLPPAEKLPIPVEHQIIQQVFEKLLHSCMNATSSIQGKKKLDDVAKKLEALYDKLRESALSASVIQGMHALVQYVQARDYQSSLMLHSQLVAASNFTEISGFMPGVKVLIQSCQQMNVFI